MKVYMITGFLDVFGEVPLITERMLSFVSPSDAMRVGRTCGAMHK
jgi:hypothetical protein